MKCTRIITAVWASLVLGPVAGCLDGGLNNDTGGGEGGPGRQAFESSVRPIVAPKCGSSGCHSGTGGVQSKFLGDPGTTDDYDAIMEHAGVLGGFNADQATLLTKVTAGGHYGVSYSSGDISSIKSWLETEKANGAETKVNPVASGALATWAGCMSINAWNTAGMGEWSNKNSNQGPCEACHNDGAYRFNTNSNNDTMYNMNRSDLYVISFFTLATSNTGEQSVVPAYDKLVRMGNNTTTHPTYNIGPLDEDGVPTDEHFQRLKAFHSLVSDAQASGDCLEPGFYTP
jgi:hypothetical protein